jgi:hypothetical protein
MIVSITEKRVVFIRPENGSDMFNRNVSNHPTALLGVINRKILKSQNVSVLNIL